MKGILQMYDVEALKGADRMEQEIRDRSRSLGRDASLGARSADRSTRVISPLGKPTLGLGMNQEFSQPNLMNDPKIRMGDSFQTEKREGALLKIAESQNKAMAHEMELRFDN